MLLIIVVLASVSFAAQNSTITQTTTPYKNKKIGGVSTTSGITVKKTTNSTESILTKKHYDIDAALKKMKEEADKINGADALIFSTEKQLKEYGDKISADKKAAIEAGLVKLKAAFEARSFADIDSASAEVNNAWNAASEEMYAASQGGSQPQGDAGQANKGNQGGDDVTDVEYEEVK